MNNTIRLGCILITSLPLCGDADIIAQWHFDEPAGSPAAVATIGGINGILSGSVDFVAGGISGNALSLSTAGDGVVSMGDNFPMTNGDFSIVVWVKTEPGFAGADSFVVAKHRSTIIAGYIIGLNANGAYGEQDKAWFYDSNGTPGDDPRSTTSVNDGLWHQVAAIYRSGGTSEIHVDGPGVEDSKPADPIGPIPAPLLIGGVEFGTQPVSLLNGQVDELQLYDHALNSCQLQYLFDNPGEIIPDDCDQDGVEDNSDNCTLVQNPAQVDADADGFGNICDADFDNNCLVNFSDLQIMKAGFLTPDPELDLDSSGGLVNFADLAIMKTLFLLPPGPSGASNVCNTH